MNGFPEQIIPMLWKNISTGETSPAMCARHGERLFCDRTGSRYCRKCVRTCPACRGYELERSWCSVCNKTGIVFSEATP